MKKSHIILLFLIALCIGVFAAKLGSVDSYVNVDEAVAKQGKTVQMIGTLVKNEPVDYNPQLDPNSFSFYLNDRAGKKCRVICYDDMPRDFEKSDQIVLTGSMKDSIFYAQDLLVKCPSKYVNKQVANQ